MINFRKYNNVTEIRVPPEITVSTDDLHNAFKYMTNLKTITFPTDKIVNMSYAFENCYNLISSPICGPNVTNMYYTYYNCRNLTGSPVCGPNVTDMHCTYEDCYHLTGSPVCGDNVANMHCTYDDCYRLTGSPVCGPNVTDMSGTYWGCANLTGSPVCGNKVIHMSRAYQHCYNLTGSPVCGPNVTSMIETYYNCTNLTGSPVCGNNVTSMSYTYWNCCNLTGKAICGPNVTSMSYTYTNCVNITNAIIGQKVTNIYKTYAGCSSLIDLTILSPWVKYNNTLTNANPNLKIYVPEESFNQYIESEWGLHGIFMNENRNIYLLTPSDTLLFFNEIKQHTLDFRKLNNNFSAISNVSVNSKDETIATISNVIINENSISFDMQSFEKEGTSMVTITYSDGIQTYSSTFQIYVFQNRPEFTYSIEPIEGANYTFVLDENEEYYQNNVTDGIEDYAICKIVLNANGAKKLYIDYSSDFYPNNYGYFSYLNETFELSNTEEENYLKRVGWNGESGTVDYGVIPFGRHEIYVKYYKCHWIEWGTGLFKFKIRIEDIDTQEN